MWAQDDSGLANWRFIQQMFWAHPYGVQGAFFTARKLIVVLGGINGTYITGALTQVLYNVIHVNMSVHDAINHKRVCVQGDTHPCSDNPGWFLRYCDINKWKLINVFDVYNGNSYY